MTGWTPLFQQIIGSSIWSSEDHVRIAWITMLACCRKDGICPVTAYGLARLANIDPDKAEDALVVLSSPDPDTLTQERDGRRIERVDGGWRLLNWEKYREMAKSEMAREQNRERQSAYRERHAGPRRDPTLEEVKAAFAKGGGTDVEAEKFFNHYQSNGWRVGRLPMKSMPHAVAGWITRAKEGAYGNASGGGTWESTKKLEAIQAGIKEIMDRGTEDAMGWRAASDKDRSELSRLKKKKKEIEEGLTK